jgi:hypothetical protein
MPDRLKRVPAWARIGLFATAVVVTAYVAIDLGTTEAGVPSRAITPCTVDPATMRARGCSLLRSDTAKVVDPEPGRWGNIECADNSRQLRLAKGGDTQRRADGKKQGDSAYRRLTVIDGDDFYGERCELGRNERRYGVNRGSQTSGTFALYGEGEHMITFFSQRYPVTFPSDAPAWQVILQMKQT